MSAKTTIEWTDATWNPVRGCTEISLGCAKCYARVFAERFRGVSGHPFEQGFDIRLVPKKLTEPFRWGKQQRVFVNSMSDLFHEQVPDLYIASITSAMMTANWHTYQVLTKRAERLRKLLNTSLRTAAEAAHIWWGVSVENRKHGVPRIDLLRETPAAVRFLSVEPLLEDLGELDLTGIHWVIVGGESGPGARPMNVAWVRSIRDQCVAAGVKFFFKQWGGVHKKATGRVLDGRTYDDMPSLSINPVPLRPQRRALLQVYKELWPADGFEVLSDLRHRTVAAASNDRRSRYHLETVNLKASTACTACYESTHP
ncbi:MAG: phage Gp37/Gp68 family protein [Planctomycetes bacterium]|nr:phage Gp37/Gp68 family protein [Planctomycetota bacterium]